MHGRHQEPHSKNLAVGPGRRFSNLDPRFGQPYGLGVHKTPAPPGSRWQPRCAGRLLRRAHGLAGSTAKTGRSEKSAEFGRFYSKNRAQGSLPAQSPARRVETGAGRRRQGGPIAGKTSVDGYPMEVFSVGRVSRSPPPNRRVTTKERERESRSFF